MRFSNRVTSHLLPQYAVQDLLLLLPVVELPPALQWADAPVKNIQYM